MKVAICGSAATSSDSIPFDDPEWEIWACSPGSLPIKRANRWFDFHVWEKVKTYKPEYVEFIKNFPGPVYTGGPIKEIKNCVVYPIDEIEREFTSYFLNSSGALMMAYAISLKPEIIGLFGIEMTEGEEYTKQRPGIHFFVLEALRRGIGIFVPKESCVLRPQPVYGISEWTHEYIQSSRRYKMISHTVLQGQEMISDLQKQVEEAKSVLKGIDYHINFWSSPYGLPVGKVIRSKDEN